MVRKKLSSNRWQRCTDCRGTGGKHEKVTKTETRTRKRGRGIETYTVKVEVTEKVKCGLCDGKGGYYPIGSEG